MCLRIYPPFDLLDCGPLGVVPAHILSNELDNTAGLLDLLFSFGADVARADDNRDRNATLAQQFRVAVVEEVDDGSGLGSRRRV